MKNLRPSKGGSNVRLKKKYFAWKSGKTKKWSKSKNKFCHFLTRIDDRNDTSVLDPTWVTTKQLAQHLGISVAAVTNIRGTKISFYKIVGRILFKREEVDEYIQKSRYMSGGDRLDEYLNRHR